MLFELIFVGSIFIGGFIICSGNKYRKKYNEAYIVAAYPVSNPRYSNNCTNCPPYHYNNNYIMSDDTYNNFINEKPPPYSE